MGHTGCGGCKAALGTEPHGGVLDLYLNNIRSVHEKYRELVDAVTDPAKRGDKLAEFNVIEQINNVWKNPYV